ncbi:MAG: MlaD family protein, partial [Xanthomonadales bacterium]|nr:MlaD family protein [Xanthomonadales bacterium]
MKTDSRSTYAIGAGLFILLGFAALAYLATQTTSLANYSAGEAYDISATFSNIGQLKDRAPVKLAGVRIGSVASITLDPTTLRAKVILAIDKRYSQIPDDSGAAIFTSGLLG